MRPYLIGKVELDTETVYDVFAMQFASRLLSITLDQSLPSYTRSVTMTHSSSQFGVSQTIKGHHLCEIRGRRSTSRKLYHSKVKRISMATYEERQIEQGPQLDALPALERLAANPSLRSRALRRFEREEPPPYASSIESDEDDLLYHPAIGSSDELFPTEYRGLLGTPLDEKEQQATASGLHGVTKAYDAGERYENEARLEQGRLRHAYFSGALKEATRAFVGEGRAGRQRCKVIVRHNIRTHWQKLGVWNRDWGIPGRHGAQPNDNASRWKWPWQHGQYASEWSRDRDAAAANAQHPISRAVRLRKGLRREEHSPVLPRRHLERGAPAPQAESFITSRPWFVFLVESREEWQRTQRLPPNIVYQSAIYETVREWWKQRGDWRDEWEVFEDDFPVLGWKWRHESPEPERCDLRTLDIEDMDFSSSEIDALEAIPPPTPRPAPTFNPHLRPVDNPDPNVLFNLLTRSAAPREEIDEATDVQQQPREPTGDMAVLPQDPSLDEPLLRQRRRNDAERPQLAFPPLRRSARLAKKQASGPPPVSGPEEKAARKVPARQPPRGEPKRLGQPKKRKEPSEPAGPPTVSETSAPFGRRGRNVKLRVVQRMLRRMER